MTATASAARARPGPILKLKKVTPHHGSTFVPLTTRVALTFDRAVDFASLTPDTVELRRLSGGTIAVAYTLESRGRKVVMTPAAKLEAATDYQIVVRPGVLTAPVGRRILGGRTIKRER